MAVAITADVRDTYPPHVLVAVTGLTASDVVTLYRVVAGERTAIRGSTDVTIVDTSLVRVDAEFPFALPVRWLAVVNGSDEYLTDPETVELPGGKVALSDALTGASAEVVIWSHPEKRVEREASTFPVGGRTVAVLGQMAGASYSFEVMTETDSARANLDRLLRGATAGTVLVRQPGGYGDVDAYVAVLAATRRRVSQSGLDQRRVHALDVVEVEPWAASQEARGYTYADLAALFDGLTYADLEASYSTYLDLALADLGGA